MNRVRAFVFVLIFLGSIPAHAYKLGNEKRERTETVRAAILYHLLRYVQPKGSNNEWASSTLCIFNNDILYLKAQDLFSTKTHKNKIILRNPSHLNCDVVVWGTRENDRRMNIQFRPTTLLVVLEESFLESSGMIGLIEDEGKIKIDINLMTLKRAGFQVNPDLLAVARRVLN